MLALISWFNNGVGAPARGRAVVGWVSRVGLGLLSWSQVWCEVSVVISPPP